MPNGHAGGTAAAAAHVFALLHGHAHDPRHGLHAQLLHRLARLLLAPRLLGLRAIALPLGTLLQLRHVVVRVILVVRLDLGLVVLRNASHLCLKYIQPAEMQWAW